MEEVGDVLAAAGRVGAADRVARGAGLSRVNTLPSPRIPRLPEAMRKGAEKNQMKKPPVLRILPGTTQVHWRS